MQITVSLATIALTSMALFKITDQFIETLAAYGGFDENIDFEKVSRLLLEIQEDELPIDGNLHALLQSDRLETNRCLVRIFSEQIAFSFDTNDCGTISDSENS